MLDACGNATALSLPSSALLQQADDSVGTRKLWIDDEDCELRMRLDARMPTADIAKAHERTYKATQTRALIMRKRLAR